MAGAYFQRLSRRALRNYGALNVITSLLALGALAPSAISSPDRSWHQLTAEAGSPSERKLPSSRRSLGDWQHIPLATGSSDGTLASGESTLDGSSIQPPDTEQHKGERVEEENAALPPMKPQSSPGAHTAERSRVGRKSQISFPIGEGSSTIAVKPLGGAWSSVEIHHRCILCSCF